ncbi:Integral membrane protein OS=Streptomyces fumanus OX=67302 GN=GCM10018772_34090 PE=4 SV=1 [Streptomyces fumanus]
MSAALVAVVLSLVSAVAYAAAAVAQERLAARRPGTGLAKLLAGGAWWWSVTLNASAALLHVVALKYGPLTVVQPLGALTLVAAVPLGARLAGRRVGSVEWRGTGLTLLGLGALLLTASGPAPDDVLSGPEALAVSGVTAVLIGTLSRPGARPGLRHATASGVASGVASALTQTVTVAATDRSGPLLSVQVVGVAVLVAAFAVGGLLLSQTAYRGGLGAPLAVVTLANPVAAAVIGVALLGERLRGGAAGVLLALTGAALAAWGVLLLTRATPRAAPESQPGTATPQSVFDAVTPQSPPGTATPQSVFDAVTPQSPPGTTTPPPPPAPDQSPVTAPHRVVLPAPPPRRSRRPRRPPSPPRSPFRGSSRPRQPEPGRLTAL